MTGEIKVDSFNFLGSPSWFGTSVDITKIKKYMNIRNGSFRDHGFSDNSNNDDDISPSLGQKESELA